MLIDIIKQTDVCILDSNLHQASLQLGITAHAEPSQAEYVLGSPTTLKAHFNNRTPTRLKWAQSSFAGVDQLINTALHKDHKLVRTTALFGPAIFEYVLGHILAWSHHHQAYQKAQKQQEWQALIKVRPLATLNIAIIGAGDIGLHLTQQLQNMGPTVTAFGTRTQTKCGIEVIPLTALEGCYDVLISTLPLTSSTQHIIDQTMLMSLQDDGLFINVGRGQTLARNGLKHFSHYPAKTAVLDVFETEPLAANSPLWALENVIITPHVSAPSDASQVVRQFFHNIQAHAQGLPINGLVDPKSHY